MADVRLASAPERDEPLIEVDDLVKHFPIGGGFLRGLTGGKQVVRAVNGVSFSINRGEAVGLAGESGCGKTTTARLLLKLYPPTSGAIRYAGHDLSEMRGPELKAFRRRTQLMFQNPYESFSPRFTIQRSLQEPLVIHGLGSREEQVARVRRALEDVHLRPADAFLTKFPYQLSGGQLQRAVLARALILDPEVLVADEPVSMLDVSVRAGILNTMRELSRERNLTTIYISHDLSLIRYLCDTTAIMYLGQIVEIGPTAEIIDNPKHPYTQALVASIPVPEPNPQEKAVPILGGIPSAVNLPTGCPFHPRCPYAMEICKEYVPGPIHVAGRDVRCYLHDSPPELPADADTKQRVA
jgi:oligopeptide/dipeptide ABC transporter ATP-binding protein